MPKLIICPSIVAKAAPFMPIPMVKIKIGSRTILSKLPRQRPTMEKTAFPWDFNILLSTKEAHIIGALINMYLP